MVIGTRALGAWDGSALVQQERKAARAPKALGRRNRSSVARALWLLAERSARGEVVCFPLAIPLTKGQEPFLILSESHALSLLRELGGKAAKLIPSSRAR